MQNAELDYQMGLSKCIITPLNFIQIASRILQLSFFIGKPALLFFFEIYPLYFYFYTLNPYTLIIVKLTPPVNRLKVLKQNI